MSEKVLQIQMFGGFSMHYGSEVIVMKKVENSKSVRLLQMLLLSSKSGIAKNELMENLYGWDEKVTISNRNRNLNNLIYRLKGQLASCGLPGDEYVEIRDGICYFKSSVPLELDTQRFENLIEEADRSEGEKYIELLAKANEMYCGELLPANLFDMWFFQKSKYYKEMYVRTILELEQEYLRKKDYKNRLILYTRAASIYPFEDWQIRLIHCNLEMYRYEEALDVYKQTIELYVKEMGTPPIEEMQECFEKLEWMDDDCQMNSADLNRWKSMDKVFLGRKSNIRKTIYEEVEGAYYCTYPSFVDYCRLVVRVKERNKFHAALMFLTLSQGGNGNSQKQIDLQEQMQLLKKVIGASLRKGDAYTRYGKRHFILMLVETKEESCSAIFQRIEKAYAQKSGKGELWYYVDMTQELSESVI